MKQRRELMAAVGAHRVHAEGKRPDHIVCEGDGVLLCVSPVDAERANYQPIRFGPRVSATARPGSAGP